MSKRIEWIDVAKGIGIWLMIFNHIALDYGQNAMKIFIASFHMPLFFIISGFTMNGSHLSKHAMMEYILKRVVTLLIPYFLWVTIFANGINLKNIFLILWSSNQSLSKAGTNAALWFLPCFFVSNIIVRLMLHCISFIQSFRVRVISLIGMVLFNYIVCIGLTSVVDFVKIGYPFGFNIAFLGNVFVLLGYIIRMFCEKYTDMWEKITVNKCILCTSLVVVFIVTGVGAYMNLEATKDNGYGRAVMAISEWGVTELFILTGISGSLLIIFIARKIVQLGWLSISFQRIGKITVPILAIHYLVQLCIEKVIGRVDILKLGGVFIPLLVSVLTLTISYFISEILVMLIPGLKSGNLDVLKNISHNND